MQRRVRTADLAFFAVLSALIALPIASPLTQSSSGSSSSGSSNSGGGGSTAGSSNGSSNSGGEGDTSGTGGSTGGSSNSSGSGSSADGGSGGGGGGDTSGSGTGGGGTTTTGTATTTSGGTPTPGIPGNGTPDDGTSNSNGGTSRDDSDAPLVRPIAPGTPQALLDLVPAIGTVTELTVRTLPPFLFLGCLSGLIAGADALPGPVFYPVEADAPTAIAQLCSRIDVRPLAEGFGGSGLSSNASSNVSARDVDPDQVQIRIEVTEGGQIVVQQELREVKQRVALSLVAALLIIVIAVGLGFVVGRGRRQP